ncbi:hypothetical protein [Desulfuromonas acetoxidans]|uniref:Rubrerythrin diiron-binding domain-containing protein n=1 Tax=Desulfuromonas acetoxidans (strain DSM 684 / 11070) TaxID=281689 RepID=Q1K1Q8_DESA6|nr:hypothetical protein [Desulfuromonas acetoxidans]EAT16330.1 hypothetical protein Dace_1794 [Desulfuromonas acetoxidans DSM 684]MBF0645993.1 hypothetical protein [Desulfuromonas acetoxidans]NVD23469.1 hypothetical protein [Desulfuromonas acetoxidans]NVE16145.1 hypothetical protein [Desulfuromonas acetoxidans]
MIPHHFFSRCVHIERSIGNLYHHWAQQGSYPEHRRQMWKKLSEDEEGHALEIELASRLALKDESFSATLSFDALDDLCCLVDELFEEVKNNAFSDADAVKIAVDLEAQTTLVHARNALQFTSPRLKKMFQALGHYNHHHLEALAAAYEELFDNPPSALTQLSSL